MIAMAPPRPSRPRSSQYRPSPPSAALQPQAQVGPESARDTRFPLIPGPAAASVARAHLRAAISSWRLPVDVDVAVLLVSELVANAVIHGDEGAGALAAVTMIVRCSGGELRVEVHDRSRDIPVPASLEVPDDSETGRGLMLVDTLAAEWGYYLTPGGKAVYFTLPLRDSPCAPPNGVAQSG
jgi:anti-sigma regulatory factor (Ser/Thr protein kinase)